MDAELAGVARCVNAIHGLGGIVKDPTPGSSTSGASRGVEAFLCWQLGRAGSTTGTGSRRGSRAGSRSTRRELPSDGLGTHRDRCGVWSRRGRDRGADRRRPHGQRTLDPVAATRYRVLQRTVSSIIITVGVLSALLTIPSVRAVAGGVLASTAIIGLVLGLAAQRTLSNFVAGILIAVAQPVRASVTSSPSRIRRVASRRSASRTPSSGSPTAPGS